uniref:Gastric inhibitory polypeptide receptor n=1 Tax=Myripristis murdjan TaxID=586833 RepID=A0A667YTL4_9TELE
ITAARPRTQKLRCTRNYIHTNLFASFILRAISILTRDALLSRDTPEFRDSRDVSDVLSDQTVSGCRVAQVLMQYCVGANYYWLLVEGLYLHNLLVLMVFSENSYFCGYLLIGWGTPVLFVVPWIIVRYLYENTRCWEINENMAHWWIIRTPILLAILVNFFIFIRIIQILISKLKAHKMRYTDYKFRLAKSTLTLIPLLGIHEVVFAMMTEEQTEGVLRTVNLFFQLFFNSFQGLLVAILYCFVNKEVSSVCVCGCVVGEELMMCVIAGVCVGEMSCRRLEGIGSSGQVEGQESSLSLETCSSVTREKGFTSSLG